MRVRGAGEDAGARSPVGSGASRTFKSLTRNRNPRASARRSGASSRRCAPHACASSVCIVLCAVGVAGAVLAARWAVEARCEDRRPTPLRLAPIAGALQEHRTFQEFALSREAGSAGVNAERQFLCGTALRCMMGWCKVPMARAYAFAFYVDEAALRSSRALLRRDGANEVQRLLDAKAADPALCELMVSLRMARDIDGTHLAHGFRNSVRQHFERAHGKPGEPVDATSIAAIDRLANAFEGATLRVGDEIAFVWRTNGSLGTSLRGETLSAGEVDDPRIARAVFDVYTSDKGVSSRGRDTFVRNLVAMTDAVAAGETDVAAPVRAEHASRTK